MAQLHEDEHGIVRLRLPERSQVVMSYGCLDERLPAEHPARVIWAVACKLDLWGFCQHLKAVEGSAGRDATDPRVLVALWLYAYSQGIGSARRLAELCTSDDAYRWLCGGLSMNYHSLSDFRVGHEQALDELLTQVLAALVDQKLLSVKRICQDGTKVRLGAGASSFKGKERLEQLLVQSKAHVAQIKKQAESQEAVEVSARQQAAQERAAQERLKRIEQAMAQLPKLEGIKKKKNGKPSKKEAQASTTDAEARRMKMPGGGSRPAVNVQVATDPASRLVVGVSVTDAPTDHGQLEPMRQQVQERTGQCVQEHLADGGYVKLTEIDQAAEQGVSLYMPVPLPRKLPEQQRYVPKASDSEAVAQWRVRMGTDEAKEIYKQRGATSETVNADLKRHRGLEKLLVRGLGKIKCLVLWSVLAYNLLHCGAALVN